MATHDVSRVSDLGLQALKGLLEPLGLTLRHVAGDAPIPASYWGAPEAGIVGAELFVRDDTPVHSVLHTACHFLCMDEQRRASLHTDCGGTDLEESAVCYLQTLLAGSLEGYSRERLWDDMDRWGYSFRLGSARDWFEQDADDARRWLVERREASRPPFHAGSRLDTLLD